MSWQDILKVISEKENTASELRQELVNTKGLTNEQISEVKKRIRNLKNKSDKMFPFEVQYIRARIAGKTDSQALREIMSKHKKGD